MFMIILQSLFSNAWLKDMVINWGMSLLTCAYVRESQTVMGTVEESLLQTSCRRIANDESQICFCGFEKPQNLKAFYCLNSLQLPYKTIDRTMSEFWGEWKLTDLSGSLVLELFGVHTWLHILLSNAQWCGK